MLDITSIKPSIKALLRSYVWRACTLRAFSRIACEHLGAVLGSPAPTLLPAALRFIGAWCCSDASFQTHVALLNGQSTSVTETIGGICKAPVALSATTKCALFQTERRTEREW